jgi:hypothetical protein
MSHMDVGNIAEWVAALGSIATAVIAGMALNAWRDQIRGTSRHQAAAEIAEAALLMKYHFYDARGAFYGSWEFPPAYHSNSNRTRADEANGWAFVYQKRWDHLSPEILRLATLRAKAGAVLSAECAVALGELAKKARELNNFFAERVEQIRVGPNIVSQWTDQDWVKKVEDSVEAAPDNPTDSYTLEFEEKFQALKDLIEPFI